LTPLIKCRAMSKPITQGAYVSQYLSFGVIREGSWGKLWSPTGLGKSDRPGGSRMKTEAYGNVDFTLRDNTTDT